jgi:hypothetical protein
MLFVFLWVRNRGASFLATFLTASFQGATAQRKINGYRQQYSDNHKISSLPAIDQSDSFRSKGAAFYQSLKSKVGLAAAKRRR